MPLIPAAVLQPFDVIKTMQQGQRNVETPTSMSTIAAYRRNRGPLVVSRMIYQEGGVLAFWRGLEASVLRVFFGAGLYFCTLQTILNFKTKQTDGKLDENTAPSSARGFSAGAAARTFAATVMNPVSVVKTRVEWGSQRYTQGHTGSNPYRHAIPAAVHIAKTEGLRGLYAGLLPTLVRDAPYSGIYYVSFSNLKAIITANIPTELSPLQQAARNFVAGVLGGVFATMCTHPADVLKTRLQVKQYETPGLSALGVVENVKRKSAGVIYELAYILRHEGIASLYSGATVRVTKRALSTAITWTIFEEGLRRFRNSNKTT